MPLIDSHDIHLHIHVGCCTHRRTARLKLGPVRPKEGNTMATQSFSMTTAQEIVVTPPTTDSQGEPFDPAVTLSLAITEQGPLTPVVEDVIAGDGLRVLRSAHVGTATVVATLTLGDGSTVDAGTYTIAVGNSGIAPDASVFGAIRSEVV